MKPDYKRIFNDIINTRYPHKKDQCVSILNKRHLTVLYIIELNIEIKDKHTNEFNLQLRSYDSHSIKKILDYQKEKWIKQYRSVKAFRPEPGIKDFFMI